MLGHIFENLLEDNKDKGAYYTPKEIVHYMCQESLIEYLTTWFENQGYDIIGYASIGNPEQPELFPINEFRQGQLELEIVVTSPSKKIDRILIEKLLKKTLDDNDQTLIKQYSTELNQALDRVKICDPAIGSGAFPMGLLHEIFTAKQTLHIFESGNTTNFNASGVKLNIIQNSIYGVDIERGAVDIARLRFWLSLIVDEPEPKALPNLDYKIVVGNSLVSKLGDDIIDIDWNIDQTAHGLFGHDLAKQQRLLLRKISQEQKEFFSPDSDKKKLSADIRNLKIDLLINQLELMVKTQGQETEPLAVNFKDKKKFVKATEQYYESLGWKNTITQLKKLKTKPELSLNFFDWKLDFPEVMNEQVVENVGFDIVIGNPPYIFSRNNLTQQEKDNFNKLYKLTQFKINLYILFMERGYFLMNNKSGVFFYITPNNWLTLETNSDLRKFILSQTKNIKILQNYANVFESASVDTVIVGFKNTGIGSVDYLEWVGKKPFIVSSKSTNEYLSKNKFIISNETENQNSFLTQLTGLQLQTICDVKNGVQAYTVGEGSPICTEEMKKNRIYHNSVRKDNTWVKYLDGVDVCRYSLGWSGQYIKYGKNLSRPRQENLFIGDRILVRQIPSQLPYCINACLTNEHTINDNNSMIVKLIDVSFSLKYILGLLNSKLLSKWFAIYFGKLSRKIFPQFKINELRIFPIAKASNQSQTKIENLVNQIIPLKSEGKDTTALEQKIDNLVYKLYELTYEEVKIIDPEFALTEQEYDAIKVE